MCGDRIFIEDVYKIHKVFDIGKCKRLSSAAGQDEKLYGFAVFAVQDEKGHRMFPFQLFGAFLFPNDFSDLVKKVLVKKVLVKKGFS